MLRGRRGSRLLAQTSGGAIPEIADFRVILDPEDTFIGTLNEDFAIESNAGDIFQLGNASWRILQVDGRHRPRGRRAGRAADNPLLARRGAGAKRRAVARGQRPARGARRPAATLDAHPPSRASAGGGVARRARAASPRAAAEQAVAYLADGRRALGVIPSQETLVLERFFDESGGMQLVLHAPFGSRVTKAWGLALRKRFCRQFNFELQAAATEDGLMLSLGPQHSFPLSDVFRYLHPETTRDVLVQAFLDAPVFETRWRWNATLSLAVPRTRGGRKLAPQVQRMLAADLLASVFPDAAACLENIPGDRQIPDHPLVGQTVRDCLEEAMDLDGLNAVLGADPPRRDRARRARHAGAVGLRPRDPRRQAVRVPRRRAARRAAEPRRSDAARGGRGRRRSRRARSGGHRSRARRGAAGSPQRRRAARCAHDRSASSARASSTPRSRAVPRRARGGRRACRCTIGGSDRPSGDRRRRGAASRALRRPSRTPRSSRRSTRRASRARRLGTRRRAIVELLRGRLCLVGPTTRRRAGALARHRRQRDADAALLALESEGVVLRGRFDARRPPQRAPRRMVRPRAARAHPPLHAQPAARGDRAGEPGRFHAVPVQVAARRSAPIGSIGLDGLREALDDARRLRAGRRGLGTVGASRPRRRLRPGDARHAVPGRRSRLGAASRRGRPS